MSERKFECAYYLPCEAWRKECCHINMQLAVPPCRDHCLMEESKPPSPQAHTASP